MTSWHDFKRHGKRLGTVAAAISLLIGLQSLPVGVAHAAPASITLTGTPTVGETLTASVDGFPCDATGSLRWFHNGNWSELGTGASYVLKGTDAGYAIYVETTCPAPYTWASATSATVSAADFSTAGTPEVSGTAKVGEQLTGSTGTWSPTQDSFNYQWLRDGSNISDATNLTYTAVAADAGKKLSFKVTAIKTGYNSSSATSAETARVAVGTMTAGTPSITGTAKVGSKLTAHTGSWSPTPSSYDYQWLRGGVVIVGATESIYTLTTDDLNANITVAITGTATGYASAEATSSAIGPVATQDYTTTGTPSVSGSTIVGATVWADPGSWDPTPDSFAYQWLRDGNTISGATNSIYRLTSADLGKKISVRVTATKGGYAAAAVTSAQTSAVTNSPAAKLTAFAAKSVKIDSSRCVSIPLTATYDVSTYQAWSITKVTLTTQVTNKNGKKIGTATLTGSGPDYTPRSGKVVSASRRSDLIGNATGTFQWCSEDDLGAIRFAAPKGTWTGVYEDAAAGGTISSTLTASAHVRAGIRLGVPKLVVKGTTRTLSAGFRAWVPSAKAWKPLRGSTVSVQKLVGSTWVPVKSVKISVKGKVNTSWRAAAPASYRLVFAGTGTKIAVKSGVIVG